MWIVPAGFHLLANPSCDKQGLLTAHEFYAIILWLRKRNKAEFSLPGNTDLPLVLQCFPASAAKLRANPTLTADPGVPGDVCGWGRSQVCCGQTCTFRSQGEVGSSDGSKPSHLALKEKRRIRMGKVEKKLDKTMGFTVGRGGGVV